MAGVVLSHSSQFLAARDGFFAVLLQELGMIATPAFLLLSGAVCSQVLTHAGGDLASSRWKLIDRGVFLLLVSHWLFGLTHSLWMPAPMALFQSFYITDAVGVGLLVAAALFGRFSRNQFIAAGGVLLLITWIGSCVLESHSGASRALVRFFVGLPEIPHHQEGWVVPLLPYLGLFMLGAGGGMEYAARRLSGMSDRTIANFCFSLGLLCIAVAVVLKSGWLLSKPYFAPGSWWAQQLYRLTDPVDKIPPSVGYIFGFGGAGLCMAGTIIFLSLASIGHKVVEGFAVVGRASLFVFVVQYWLTFVPARALHIQGGAGLWLGASLFTVAGVGGLAWLWDSLKLNRILTVGLRGPLKPPSAAALAGAVDLTAQLRQIDRP